MGLTRCYKTAVFYIYICSYYISVHSWDINASAFGDKRLSCWNSTFGFDFVCQQCVILHQQQQHVSTTGKPNFIQIGPTASELWRYMAFSSWRQPRRECTSGFRFGDVLHLRRSKPVSFPNFDKIFQSAAEIQLNFRFGNKWPSY